jgi:hypothetical protein
MAAPGVMAPGDCTHNRHKTGSNNNKRVVKEIQKRAEILRTLGWAGSWTQARSRRAKKKKIKKTKQKKKKTQFDGPPS